MARGFWTGLGHGAALSVVVLLALSLISPVTRPAPDTAPQDGGGQDAAEDGTTVGSQPDTASVSEDEVPTPPDARQAEPPPSDTVSAVPEDTSQDQLSLIHI